MACCYHVHSDTLTRIDPNYTNQIQQYASFNGWPCGDKGHPAEIIYDQYFTLGDGSLLVFIEIPDYLCSSNSFMPVLVDNEGNWQYGQIMEGVPSLFSVSPDGTYWLTTQWSIEGSYPLFFKSFNGIHWFYMGLPDGRDVDCCSEYIAKVCKTESHLYLSFEGERTKHYQTKMPQFDWQEIPENNIPTSTCLNKQLSNTPTDKGKWIKNTDESLNEVRFVQNGPQGTTIVVLPYRVRML